MARRQQIATDASSQLIEYPPGGLRDARQGPNLQLRPQPTRRRSNELPARRFDLVRGGPDGHTAWSGDPVLWCTCRDRDLSAAAGSLSHIPPSMRLKILWLVTGGKVPILARFQGRSAVHPDAFDGRCFRLAQIAPPLWPSSLS